MLFGALIMAVLMFSTAGVPPFVGFWAKLRIIQALIETQGNQVQASKLLGITRATLRKRVEKFNIRKELAVT